MFRTWSLGLRVQDLGSRVYGFLSEYAILLFHLGSRSVLAGNLASIACTMQGVRDLGRGGQWS